jgi:thiamine-phosphate pyrophosphorylase
MLVTDRRRAEGRPHDGEEALDDVVRDAVLGGVDVVQLREKDLDTTQLIAMGLHVRDAVADRALLFVNGDIAAARTLAADGVHLPADSAFVGEARGRLRDGVLVSVAVHSLEEAVRAEAAGADLLVLGTVFATASKPGITPLGIARVRAVCEAVRAPVVAIGGITAENAADVIGAGAAGVAVIGAICDAADARAAARALRSAIDAATSRGS